MNANTTGLYLWGSGIKHGRWDYDTSDHVFAEMMNEEYFGNCVTQLKVGDYVYITDAENELYLIRIDEVLREARKVRFSLVERYKALPVTQESASTPATGFAYRWRGPRGGGHSIVNADGAVVEAGFPSREEAERALAARIKQAA